MTVNKFDIISWVKDGAWVLPATLLNLESVLPSEFVHRKIAVDDGSSDDTVKILKDFGWDVYRNPSSGISSGANYGLSKVESPFFMSFEQDLFLTEDWWHRIPELLDDSSVAVASGVRFSTKPDTIRDLEKYVYRKYLMEEKLAPYLSNRKASVFTLGKTLDNTLYRTDVMRKVGGFPYLSTSSGVDTLLTYILKAHGFEWRVDPSCVSQHIRKGLKQELNHQRWYAVASAETRHKILSQGLDTEDRMGGFVTFKHALERLLLSPLAAAFVACKMRNPRITFVHPLIKLYWFVGYLDSRKA
ncbi:MAG: hypothetical protein CW716_09830 [Candidatus Bathyarchaeum sp.]|nr:MAG: hypothetical protein CW716_09830 [Candidatus Bathyarchaeum sp.]